MEDKKWSIQSQESSLEERLQRTKDHDGLSPSNPAEVIAALERYSANGATETVRITDIQMDDGANATLETDNGFENAALHVNLSDFFEEEAALSHIDRLTC